MGLFNEDLDPRHLHEGYLVGIVLATDAGGAPSSWRYRELSLSAGDDGNVRLTRVQMGCSCGWRSPRLVAPVGTLYFPSIVDAPQAFEDECAARWHEHLQQEASQERVFQLLGACD